MWEGTWRKWQRGEYDKDLLYAKIILKGKKKKGRKKGKESENFSSASYCDGFCLCPPSVIGAVDWHSHAVHLTLLLADLLADPLPGYCCVYNYVVTYFK